MRVTTYAHAIAVAVAAASSNVQQGDALVLLQSRAAETTHNTKLGTDSMPVAPNNSQLNYRPSLWSGMDLPDVASRTFHKRSVTADDDAWATQIMGHYNTGTNLLEALLQANFPNEFSAVDDNIVVSNCLFWKHSSLSVLRDSDASVFTTCEGRVIGLAVVRNPLSWLVSFRQMAYDLYECNKGDDWLTRACLYPYGTPSYLGGKLYDSVEEIWNAWTRDYEALADFGFDRGLLIRYEDLVLNTADELRKIAEIANLTAPDTVTEIDENMSPTHSDADERTKAIDAIQSKTYLDDLSSDELSQACSRLSAELMSQHGYDDCTGIS